MSRLFVTGAGTGVGKTFVTAHLVKIFRARGEALRAVKPLISGFNPDAPEGSDSAILLNAMNDAVTPAKIASISPWRYLAPLAPNMAARREGKAVDFQALVAWCEQQTGRVLIEGVGGVMSPISDDATVLDWIKALKCPVLLVGGSYLGAISHILTAIETLRAHDIVIAATVVSESEDGIDLHESISSLKRLSGDIPVVGLARAGAAEQIGLDEMADLHAITRQCFAD